KSDPEAQWARQGAGKEPKLSYSGNLLVENPSVQQIARTVKWKYADPSRHISTQSVGTGH
ncbi:MAG: hypothetical protein ACRD4Q_09745, partial [Candidatus Acidiferrales bacterium]